MVADRPDPMFNRGRVMIGDWMKSTAWLANVGHVMAGALVVLVIVLFHPSHDAIVTTEFLFGGWVVIKEYVLDLTIESDETWGSSTVDAIGWVAGHLAAWLLVLLAHRVSP